MAKYRRSPDGKYPAAFRTPWQVLCKVHGHVALTHDEYTRAMLKADAPWTCPHCGRPAIWDDANYEAHMYGESKTDPDFAPPKNNRLIVGRERFRRD